MKLEQQVCALELSKRLKELGVKQESLFYHYNYPYNDGDKNFIEDDWCITLRCEIPDDITDTYSAFTIAELLERLPDIAEPARLAFGIENPTLQEECGGKYYCTCDAYDYPADHSCYSDNFADCLAMMLIYLIEFKLMEIPK